MKVNVGVKLKKRDKREGEWEKESLADTLNPSWFWQAAATLAPALMIPKGNFHNDNNFCA